MQQIPSHHTSHILMLFHCYFDDDKEQISSICQNLLGTDFPSVTLKSCAHLLCTPKVMQNATSTKTTTAQLRLHCSYSPRAPKMSRSHFKLTRDSLIRTFKNSHVFTTLHILEDFIQCTQRVNSELAISNLLLVTIN